MDEVELINVVTATVTQVTHRRVAYVRPTSEFTADVGVDGGASHQEKIEIAALLPLQVVIEICDPSDEAHVHP